MKKIIFYILILKVTFSFSQVFKNDLEKFNLKENVKYIYYDKFYFKNHPYFQSNISVIGYNYYFYFNTNGNLESYGKFENDTLTKRKKILSETIVKKIDKNNLKYDSKGRITKNKIRFSKGYFKNKIASKTTYEYESLNHEIIYKITNYKTFIDTTDLGRELLYEQPEKFNPKKHTIYTFYKDNLLLYNSKKQLIKKYIYYSPLEFIDENQKSSYSFFIEFNYNQNGDISETKEYQIKWLEFPRSESYKYEYDKMNNWIKKTAICSDCVENKDKIRDILTREIIYW